MGKEGVKGHPIIICRCRDITLEDVLRAIDEGCEDLECVKRRLGLGMGPCQGRTCIPIVVGIMARRLGKKPDELLIPKPRAPVTPIPISLLLKSVDVKGGGGGDK